MMNDAEAIKRVRRGEIDAFTHIVNTYTKKVYGFIKKRVFDKEDVEDIVQEVFIKMYRATMSFDEKRPVLPYLFEIVKNELKMYYRSHKTVSKLQEEMTEEKEQEHYYESDLQNILNTLPKEQKKALTLVAEGYSYNEIARVLKKPLNTVRTIIHRARLKVAKLQI